MKTRNIIKINAIVLLGIGIGLGACSNRVVNPTKGEKTVKMPCSGDKYFSDKNHFRVNSSGESIDMVTSKKKALSNAKSELAGIINTTMKVVGDNFVSSSEVDNKELLLEKFVENSRTVIRQEIAGTNTVCEKLVYTREKKYKTYLCLELDTEDILASVHKSLSSKDQLFLDYKYEEFKKDFEHEMDRYEDEYN